MNFRWPVLGLHLALVVPVAAALVSLLAGTAYAVGTADGNVSVGTTTNAASEFGGCADQSQGLGRDRTIPCRDLTRPKLLRRSAPITLLRLVTQFAQALGQSHLQAAHFLDEFMIGVAQIEPAEGQAV